MEIKGMTNLIGLIPMKEPEQAECDYFKDGLLTCGKCGTPKQFLLKLKGREPSIVPCSCECEVERKRREKAEEDERKRREYIERMRVRAFPDRKMQFCTFESDDQGNPSLSQLAEKYVNNFAKAYAEGKGLLLYGTVGTGKTYIAACIANALIDEGKPCLVTNFPRLCNTIMGLREGKQEYIDDLGRYDLLVIDDLAAERSTEYMDETVQNIIDTRYRSGKPLIVTTNLTKEELASPADVKKERLYSRLLEMCYPFEVKGHDRRINDHKDDDLKELLGL